MLERVHEYALSDRSEVASFLPKKYKTVLEIGCAKGGFIANLDPKAEVWGIEPDPVAAAEASSRGYKMLIGLYDGVADRCSNHYFDVIICNDVIEHMVDHDKFLQGIKLKMSKGGCLVGSIPNVRHFGNLFRLFVDKDWKYENRGVLDRTHLRFFTEKSLHRTFLSNGYEIKAFGGINRDFDMPKTPRQVLRNAFLMLMIGLTFGSLRDTQNLQYGFRLALKD